VLLQTKLMRALSLLLLTSIFLTACGTAAEEVTEVNTIHDPETVIADQWESTLEDLTGGTASGTVTVIYSDVDRIYTLLASFENLPELEEGFFYEGWIIRDNDLSIVSTGAVSNNMNIFSVENDYTDHLQYVLTLEPDDGDPAPAEHILDGTLDVKES